MKTTNMTERITFCSRQTGVDPKTHRPVKSQLVDEFSVWTEVESMKVRDFTNNTVAFRRETPVFLIAYKTQKEIQSNWLIKWRGHVYEITGMDPDYEHKNLTKIAAQEVSDDGRNG
ncbi:phage head closure protein [Limosilactobacillus fermentum]|uniref:phage head closure protein n=1 Tax=Limosilactobacillus fermentum TaxID=1613 RepID=UPI003FA54075